MNTSKNNKYEFLEFIQTKEEEIYQYSPLAGSYAIIKCEDKYLLCYNVWREQWEIPAGKRETHETPKECAIRELYEETGQCVEDLVFKGLLKVRNFSDGNVKYNPVYGTTIKQLQPFLENEETTEIILWDLKETIGLIDAVDFKIFEFIDS